MKWETAIVAARNIMLGANLASLALILKPRALVEYVSENLFLFKSMSSRGLPQRNVYEVLRSHSEENIILGNLYDPKRRSYLFEIPSYASDLVNLCLICQILKPKLVFEIGTMQGYTALHFALNSPPEAKIYTLDLPKGVAPSLKLSITSRDAEGIADSTLQEEYLFRNSEVATKVTCLSGDSATFDYSRFHGSVDFFFIDGAHSYEYVRSDTRNALKCCHKGSVIAWHDFGRVGVNGVTRWLLELSKDHAIYSIPGGSLAYMVVD